MYDVVENDSDVMDLRSDSELVSAVIVFECVMPVVALSVECLSNSVGKSYDVTDNDSDVTELSSSSELVSKVAVFECKLSVIAVFVAKLLSSVEKSISDS